MINVDLLNITQRRKFIYLIKEYTKKYSKNMKSCLLIMFSSQDIALNTIIKEIKNIQALPSLPNLSNTFFLFDQKYKTCIVNSSFCGLGKSEAIKSGKIFEIMKHDKFTKKKFYYYFPIGGKFSRQSFFERLKKVPNMSDLNKIYIIHFDITQTKEINLLNEFFFKLLIFRKFDLYENVKFLGSNVEIIIEIPNDYSEYKKEIKILSYVEKFRITEIDKINDSTELITVASILSMCEKNEIQLNNFDIKSNKFKLSYKESQKIIINYLEKFIIKNPNYYQINTFIKVLYGEFIKFSNCIALSPDLLKRNGLKEKDLIIRKDIIDYLVKLTKLFLIGPYEELIKNQELNAKLMNISNDEKEKLINNNLTININSISFDQIKPSLVVFNQDGVSVNIIATCDEKENEFISLQKLFNSQNIDETKKLKNFKKLSRKEILESVKIFLSCKLNNEDIEKYLGDYVYTSDNFIKVVLILMRIRAKIPVIMMGETGCGKTTLIKMALKLINSNAKDDKKFLKIMNIHAGITDENIIQFFKQLANEVKKDDDEILNEKKKEFDNLSEKDKNAYLKRNSLKDIYLNYEEEVKNRDIWIFFDEINTCDSMGLFSEIFCKNTIYGKHLDKRFIYIAACNPYRVSDKNNVAFNVLYKEEKHKHRNLVYTVNPLPITLLNFVFNFGSLKDKDEEDYIESMVSGTIKKIFAKFKNEEEQNKKVELIDFVKKTVKKCHNYLKKNNDISIVSLREVNRFNVFLNFFFYYIINRKRDEEILKTSNTEEVFEFYNSKKDLEILYYAINLSLYICYYLRLPDKENRKGLEELLNKELNKEQYFKEGFLKIPIMEQNYIINNLEIPKGIAKNKILKENLFISFFCIINKIPLVICGKPGRSKTLSFQILQKSLKGDNSKNPFCKNYCEIKTFRIQGSLYTTSSEIINIFKKGREYQKNNNLNKKLIVVVCFDEMGLAEISENNPLKVLHSELENEKDKISFIGISNWFIDASKMNRVIYNVVQDPDEEDIIETSKEMVKSYEENDENYIEKYGNIILRVSKAYYKFINKKKWENDENQYFHGSRDFFNLIKTIMNDIIKNKEKLDEEGADVKNDLLNQICINSIERNFGGLENSVGVFKTYFFEGYEDFLNNINSDENKYNILKCIENNINDENSRYLLLIIDNCFSQELLNNILEEINEKRKLKMIKSENRNNEKEGIELSNKKVITKKDFKKLYIGSKYKADKNNVVYSSDMLKKIKEQMETDNILILKDLESVYPALYELFNQSFQYLPGKKAVYLGDNNSLALVNNKFKVIVLVNKDQIKKQEPPFLNRFEKHIIDYSSLLNDKLISLSDKIYNTLEDILNINNVTNDFKKEFKVYLNFINLEEIKGLVYIAYKTTHNNINNNDNNLIDNNNFYNNNYNNDIDETKIIEFVLKKISPCFNEKIMTLITYFGFKNKFKNYYDCINKCYRENYSYNFMNYLQKLQNSEKRISVVYTFSSIIDNIIIDDNTDNSNNEFNKLSTNEINMGTISSMEQINNEIINLFDKDNSKSLLLLKFGEEDLNLVNDIYYLLNDIIESSNSKNKIINGKEIKIRVIFVIYLKKKLNMSNNYISLLSDCPQIMISNLKNKYDNFLDILDISNEEIFQKFDFYSKIKDNLRNIMERYFSFELFNCDKINDKNFCYIDNLINNIIIQEYKKDGDNKKNKNYLPELPKKIEVNRDEKEIEQIEVNKENNKQEELKNENENEKNQNINNNFNTLSGIKDSFINIFKSEENIITKIFKENIINNKEQFNNNYLQLLDDKINELFNNNIKKIIYIFEKEQILSTFSNNPKIYENEIIKKYVFEFISNINCEDNNKYNWIKNIIDKKGKLYIIYNQKLPFTENIFKSLFEYIENYISFDYYQKDTHFFKIKTIRKEEIEIEQDKCEDEINNLDKKLKIKMCNTSKYKLIIDILNSKDEKLISYLFEDCFYFYFKNVKESLGKYDMLSQLLNLLIQFKLNLRKNNNINLEFINEGKITLKPSFIDLFNEEEEKNGNELNKTQNETNENIYLTKFVNIINYLLSYSKEIKMILELYYFLLESNDIKSINLYDKLKDIIDPPSISGENQKPKLKMENSNRNPLFKKIKKIPFFYIIHPLSIILKKQLNESLNNLCNLKQLKNLFSKKVHYHIENLVKLDRTFILFSQDIFDLDIMIKIIDKINTKVKDINKIELLKSLFDKNFNFEVNQKIKIQSLLILKIFENLDEYGYYTNKIILNHYKANPNIRQKLMEDILFNKSFGNHDKLIQYSDPLFLFIFSNFKSILDTKNNAKIKLLDYFKKNNDEIKKLIDNKNDQNINEIILYRLEIFCDNYFNKILNDENEENKKINVNERLCANLSENYLIEVINYFYGERKGIELNNICNIYCIAFIKRYLKYFIDILSDNDRYLHLPQRENINNLLFYKDPKEIKRIDTIKYYVLKLLYNNKFNKKWEDLVKYFNNDGNDIFQFNKYICFNYNFNIDKKNDSIPILLLDNLLMDNQNKEKMKYNELLFYKNLDTENKKKNFFDLFLKDNNKNYLYDFLANILFLFYTNLNQEEKCEDNNSLTLLLSINKYLNEEYKYINKDIISFINLIFNKNNFESKIKPNIGLTKDLTDQNTIVKKITILLFSLRFIYIILLNTKNDNNPIYNLLTKKISSIIRFIPNNLEEADLENLLKKEKKIKEMDKITYILLHFIILSYLFYSNIQGLLKDKYLSNYITDFKACFERIEKDWELMINKIDKIDIHLFLNIIFNDISKIFISSPQLNKKEDAIIFEKKINEIIINKIKNTDLINKYKEQNDNIIKNINPNLPKTIIQEIYPSNIYSEKQYPDLIYFYISEFPSKEHFIKQFYSEENNKDKYPIINIILTEDDFHQKLKLLKYIPKINKLCNYMIDYVSYRYTRDEAKNKLIRNEEEIRRDDEIINLSKEFIKIYKEIKPKITELDYTFSVLDENKLYLSNLCLDSHKDKDNYGFVLLEIYKQMAQWQNEFIDKVVNSQNYNLNSYKDLFDYTIKIQDCNEEQILFLPSIEKDIINQSTVMDIILNNSLRKDNKIIYNIEEIENELASFFLPKIKKFNIKEFNKVIYKDEYIMEDRNNIMTNFKLDYPQRNLTNKELNIIHNYSKKNNDFDIKSFLFNIQFVINDILNKRPNINVKLCKIMENKKICNIEIIKHFFNEIDEDDNDNDNSFSIECLIDLIDFMELIYWDKLTKNLDEKYCNEIDDSIKTKIDNYFGNNNYDNQFQEELESLNKGKADEPTQKKQINNDNDKDNNNLEIYLCSVIRKIICEYLIINTDAKIDENNKLNKYFTNINFGTKESEYKKNEAKIKKIFEETNVEIRQAFKLYQYLEGDKYELTKYNIFNSKDKCEAKNENNSEDNEDEDYNGPKIRRMSTINAIGENIMNGNNSEHDFGNEDDEIEDDGNDEDDKNEESNVEEYEDY